MSDTLDDLVRLLDPDFYLVDPFPVYARLRNEAPVYWSEEAKCWVLSTYKDVEYVANEPELFSAASGVVIGENLHPDRVDVRFPEGAENLMGSDPPRHGQLRRLVSKAFTPRYVAQLEEPIRKMVQDAFDEIESGTTVDFVEAVSQRLPASVIAEMLGIPDEDQANFKRWSLAQVAGGEAATPEEFEEAQRVKQELWSYLEGLVADRRVQPRDDLTSRLVQAELDGERLVDANVVMMCATLLGAGNDTNFFSGTAIALCEFPEQRKNLIENPALLEPATDEFLRWVSPLNATCRTAMTNTEIRGQAIEKGDYLAMLYPSANRDDDIWPNADQFDVTREPDPMHLTFGFGEHLCLGASLVRLETRLLFKELLTRFPDFELAGEPQRLNSTVVNAVINLPVHFA